MRARSLAAAGGVCTVIKIRDQFRMCLDAKTVSLEGFHCMHAPLCDAQSLCHTQAHANVKQCRCKHFDLFRLASVAPQDSTAHMFEEHGFMSAHVTYMQACSIFSQIPLRLNEKMQIWKLS